MLQNLEKCGISKKIIIFNQKTTANLKIFYPGDSCIFAKLRSKDFWLRNQLQTFIASEFLNPRTTGKER